jgi:transketolase N-terminal domain/subunit
MEAKLKALGFRIVEVDGKRVACMDIAALYKLLFKRPLPRWVA